MQIKITEIVICFSMTNEEMHKIINRDDIDKFPLCEQILKLDKVKVVEYDSMFGPHIWATIQCPPGKKANQIQNRIEKIITKYMEGGKS